MLVDWLKHNPLGISKLCDNTNFKVINLSYKSIFFIEKRKFNVNQIIFFDFNEQKGCFSFVNEWWKRGMQHTFGPC